MLSASFLPYFAYTETLFHLNRTFRFCYRITALSILFRMNFLQRIKSLSYILTSYYLYNLSHMGWKEGHISFNDTLNTFYLRLYGVGHMVKNHSDSERRNPLPPHGLLFPINSKGSFICTIPLPLLHTWIDLKKKIIIIILSLTLKWQFYNYIFIYFKV